MYVDALELSKFRRELLEGGFDEQETFNIVMAYYEAKLDSRRDDGIVFLATEQDQAELNEQTDTHGDG